MNNSIVSKYKESKLAKIFIPISLIVFLSSLFVFNLVNQKLNYIKIDAEITKMEKTNDEKPNEHADDIYNVYVKYKVLDNEYEEKYGKVSGYKEGDKIPVAYNPNNPRDIIKPVSIIFPIILFTISIICLIIGLIGLKKGPRKEKKKEKEEKEEKK